MRTARFMIAFVAVYVSIRVVTDLVMPDPDLIVLPLKALIAAGIGFAAARWLVTAPVGGLDRHNTPPGEIE